VDLAGKQQELLKEHEQQKRIERTLAAVQPVIEKQVETFRQKYPGLEKEMEKLSALTTAPPTTRPEDIRNAPSKK